MSFKVGDRVKVQYEGTVFRVSANNYVDVRDSEKIHHTYHPHIAEGFIKLSPEYEVGDLWQVACGKVYIIRKMGGGALWAYTVTSPHISFEASDFFGEYPEAKLLLRPSEFGIKVDK